MISFRDPRWDAKNIIVEELGVDTVWDSRVKNLVYNTVSMEWEAQTPSSGGSGGGGPISADTSSVEIRTKPMKSAIDEASATITYVGEAVTGSSLASGSWRIKRITQSGTVLLIEWADGDGLFNNVWNDRASLIYS